MFLHNNYGLLFFLFFLFQLSMSSMALFICAFIQKTQVGLLQKLAYTGGYKAGWDACCRRGRGRGRDAVSCLLPSRGLGIRAGW